MKTDYIKTQTITEANLLELSGMVLDQLVTDGLIEFEDEKKAERSVEEALYNFFNLAE